MSCFVDDNQANICFLAHRTQLIDVTSLPRRTRLTFLDHPVSITHADGHILYHRVTLVVYDIQSSNKFATSPRLWPRAKTDSLRDTC